MFEFRLAVEREVSFERDKLDASKACHISETGNLSICFDTFVSFDTGHSWFGQPVGLSDPSLPDGIAHLCLGSGPKFGTEVGHSRW
jgi:hypothetical protein